MKVLITAGATRNPIDAVRYLSASSSGRTGVQVARALSLAGCDVHLLGSPEAVLRAPELHTEVYSSTRDLMVRMERWVRDNPAGAVVHASAVGDYEYVFDGNIKIPSGRDELVLRLTPTPKIADHVRGWGLTGLFVTFKAAPPETDDEELVAIADRQRLRTGSDVVFANVLGRLGSGVWHIGATQWRFERRDDAIESLIERVASGRKG
ncbi:MAG: phosphopantothenoylcysteine synthetase/decarboxylase [Kiritimatiellia bacterium]|jgi:phosphopantothenoylcysteine synthetase/decarboxylase